MTAGPPAFYLGTDEPAWLGRLDVPLFVSHRRLRSRRSFPRARAPWALDSGGFTEVSTYGEWRITPREYVDAVRRYRDEIGSLEWASPQDWMCEPFITAKTGKTVAEHQRLTIENYLELKTLDAELPIVPVLQGWLPDDYLRHVDAYAAAGIDLPAEQRVGVGSVCRRQDTLTARRIFTRITARGIRIHGFGVKLDGLRVYGDLLASADSMAWSYWARRDAVKRKAIGRPRPPCGKNTCSHCTHYALAWRRKAVSAPPVTLFPEAWIDA